VPVAEPAQAGWDPRSGYQAGRKLALDPEVTAVLCGNDDLAVGVIRAMHEAGRAIPGSVSVVGFDDTPQAEFLTPALTTVRLDFTELGRACVPGRGPGRSSSCGRVRAPRPGIPARGPDVARDTARAQAHTEQKEHLLIKNMQNKRRNQ
jgi:hypothetical protein